jgi:hypothetical protein
MDSEQSTNTACTSDIGTEDEGYEENSFIKEMSIIAARLNRDSVIEKRTVEPECRWCFRPECISVAECLGQQAENTAHEREEQNMHMKEAKRLSLIGAQSNTVGTEEQLTEQLQKQEEEREEKNWHEGEIEPYEAENERKTHIEQWKKRGLWTDSENRENIEGSPENESSDTDQSEVSAEPEKVKKRVQWKRMQRK